jgi:hypothetical protein
MLQILKLFKWKKLMNEKLSLKIKSWLTHTKKKKKKKKRRKEEGDFLIAR